MYLKQLETANFKFPKKEDVMWYLMTVGGFIIVGSSLFVSFCLSHDAPRISARIVLFSQLLRFLETRKITPVCRPARHSLLRVGRGAGMVGCLYG